MTPETFYTFEMRMKHLNCFIKHNLVSMVASSYLRLLEAYGHSPLGDDIIDLGVRLVSMPGFCVEIEKCLHERKLEGAGFCTVKLDNGDFCKKPVVGDADEKLCPEHKAKFEADNKAQEDFERSPDGVVMMAEMQARVDADFPEWADPNRPSC